MGRWRLPQREEIGFWIASLDRREGIGQRNESMKDYYEILGVKRGASREEIRNRYLELAKRHHPDAKKKALESDRIKEINEAYEVLKDEARRLDYDLKHSLHRAYLKKRVKAPLRFWRLRRPAFYASVLFLLLTVTFHSRETSINVPTFPSFISPIPVSNPPPPLSEPAGREKGSRPSLGVAIKRGGEVSHPISEGVAPDSKSALFHAVGPEGGLEEEPFRSSISEALTQRYEPENREGEMIGSDLMASPTGIPVKTEIEPPSLVSAPSEEEVRAFFDRYIDHYIRRDLEGFLSLFSPQAIQNGREGWVGIKESYARFFEGSEKLTYHLEEVKITFNGTGSEVKGRYQVMRRLRNEARERLLRGHIRWVLVREGGALKILSLDYQPVK